MFVGCVHVGFVAQQLKNKNTEYLQLEYNVNVDECNSEYCTYQMHNFQMSMSSCQVQWDIVTHIGCIHTSATLQQHFHQFCVPFFGAPVQWTEAMIVSINITTIPSDAFDYTSFDFIEHKYLRQSYHD